MGDIKSEVQGMDPNIVSRDVISIKEKTGNIYTALVAITKRAKQINVDIKHELQKKLDEFAVTSETIEEVQENKEQIEISKFYEKLPNPVLIAFNEFMTGQLDVEIVEPTEDK